MNDDFKNFIDGICQTAEFSLIYYRAILNAGGTEEEASILTSALIRGVAAIKKNDKEEEK